MDLLKSFRDLLREISGADSKAEEAKQIVGALSKLADAKADIFEQQLKDSLRTAGTTENMTIPIEAVLDSYVETAAYMNDSPDVIKNTVSTAISRLAPGSNQNLVEGISGALVSLIQGFLGEATASDKTVKYMKVMPEGYSVVRIDILCWQYTVAAIGLLGRQLQSISVIVMAKSAVDMSAVNFNTFLNIYESQIKEAVGPAGIAAAIDEITEIYNRFTDDED